ncbi:MAG TPA: hypothetical protein VF389_02880, partial [Woeseiaceae bacterium]
MTGSILPRYLLLASTLSLIVVAMMLTMFYGQYRWLARGMMDTSVAELDASLAASFEGRARAQLYRVADEIADRIGDRAAEADSVNGAAVIAGILGRTVRSNESLTGLRYESDQFAVIDSGDTALLSTVQGTTVWQDDRLYLSYPVLQNDVQIGELKSSFVLTRVYEESRAFEQRLVALERDYFLGSLWWVGGAALLAFMLCITVIWT